MKEVTLRIPPQTWKKIKALATLLDGVDIDDLLLSSIDEVVSRRIVEELGIAAPVIVSTTVSSWSHEERPVQPVPSRGVATSRQMRATTPEDMHRIEQTSYGDASDISAGLGDEDDSPMPLPETDPNALVPKEGGLTDRDLDDDESEGGGEHEARVSAPRGDVVPQGAIQSGAENDFASLLGLPPPPVSASEPEPARRKRNKGKGRVSGFEGSERASF